MRVNRLLTGLCDHAIYKEEDMQISPPTAAPPPIDRSIATSPPSGAVRESAANELAANTPQLVQAARPTDAPARPDADSRPPAEASARHDRPGSRVNLVV